MPSEMKALFRKHDELLKELDPAQIQSIFNSSIRVTTDEAEQSVLTFIPDLKNNLSEWMNPSKVRKAEGESTLSATFDSLPDGEIVSQKTKVEWFVRTLQLPADVRQTHSTNGPLKGVASGLIGAQNKIDYKQAIESFLNELIVETDVEESKELKEGEVLTHDDVIHTLIDRYGVELVEILEYLEGENVTLKDKEGNTISLKDALIKRFNVHITTSEKYSGISDGSEEDKKANQLKCYKDLISNADFMAKCMKTDVFGAELNKADFYTAYTQDIILRNPPKGASQEQQFKCSAAIVEYIVDQKQYIQKHPTPSFSYDAFEYGVKKCR